LRELIDREITELIAAGKELAAAVTRPMREPIGV
jgi:hypothetical protein